MLRAPRLASLENLSNDEIQETFCLYIHGRQLDQNRKTTTRSVRKRCRFLR